MGNPVLGAALRELRAAGIKPTIKYGRHLRLHWILNGQRRSTTVSHSPRDCDQAIKKQAAQLKRLLRGVRP